VYFCVFLGDLSKIKIALKMSCVTTFVVFILTVLLCYVNFFYFISIEFSFFENHILCTDYFRKCSIVRKSIM